ncbi:hypothetical protein KMP13_11910 [Epibacterium ulvae]|uniref:hypothetical protein n=1 Tax=Epibacterium ulvae TaxID=1156985 RepID=UPI001BFC79DA|nr:hypothetical protein [Epibacterium ulvae]MBT8154590.1 hypothetical protein [Epibacterium ulvae]
MSITEHIPTAPLVHLRLPNLAPFLAAIVLLAALGLPALDAPTPTQGELDWHGNVASTSTQP